MLGGKGGGVGVKIGVQKVDAPPANKKIKIKIKGLKMIKPTWKR